MSQPVTREEVEHIVAHSALELRREISDSRQELRQEISDSRQELRQEISDGRQEMRDHFLDLKAEMKADRERTQQQFAEQTATIRQRDTEYTGYFSEIYQRLDRLEADPDIK